MMKIRRSDERGHANHGWLDTYHTFSFARYYDPDWMNFRSLRVMNEDWIDGGAGFPEHPHEDMEIITIVMEGALAHKDSTGGSGVIKPGEVQKMTAGSGITHSEFNGSSDEKCHLYQIWIMPNQNGLVPGYEQKIFPAEDRKGKLQLVCSNDGRDDSFLVNQDVNLYLSSLEPDHDLKWDMEKGRYAWLQVMNGKISINVDALGAGDGVAIWDKDEFIIHSNSESEFMLFDLG
ncbi:MAG TPA: pirin family protein [bacterium]|jgi:hypothetical protein